MIHRRGDGLEMAMPVRGDGPGDVNQMHHAPAQNISQKIRILRKHKLDHFGARGANRPARQRFPDVWAFGSTDLFICGSGQRFGIRSLDEYTMRSTMTQPQKKTRRQMLEEFVAAKPNDSFARYGLAMECSNSGDTAAADEQFKTLLSAHPDYVAAYFQYGQFLVRTGRIADARSTLSAGIAAAQRTGDDHARSEMEAALADLG